MRRAAALVLPILLIAAALTGCVKNLPGDAVEWLAGRGGITDARILADNTSAWSSSGLVRGELEPSITDDDIAELIDDIREYATANGEVAFRLGIDELDFVVEDGGVVALWRQVLEVPGLVSGIVGEGDARVRTLRADAVTALDALDAVDAGVRLEAFADAQTLAADALSDIPYDQVNVLALEYRSPAGCEPEANVSEFARSLLDRDDIPGATIDLCTGITLDLPAGASVATTALTLRAELDARGLSEFPVQLTSEGTAGTHFAAIAPGDPALLSVLAVFDEPTAPPVSYSLAPDRNLAVTAYDVPTTDLVDLVLSAPAASGFAGIGIEGSPVAILGTSVQLPALLAEATALDAASDTFGSVQLGQGFGSVTLEAGVGEHPDITTAVADLRASGAADGRFFSVRYLSSQLDIANDVATLADSDYVGADVLEAFVAAWNGP